MSCVYCIGCETGVDSACGHWHDPIPNNCHPVDLEDWWDLQLIKNKPLEAVEAAQKICEWWFYVRMHPKSARRAVLECMKDGANR